METACCECPLTGQSLHYLKKEKSLKDVSWNKLVYNYTKLDLTFPKDRLPALAGIARRYKKMNPEEGKYLAGLWTNSYMTNLHWRRVGKKFPPRPVPQVAPTWSWASISNAVDWDDFRCQYIKLLEAKVVPIGPDEYGELSSGLLTLSGPIVSAVLKYRTIVDCEDTKPVSFPYHSRLPTFLGKVRSLGMVLTKIHSLSDSHKVQSQSY